MILSWSHLPKTCGFTETAWFKLLLSDIPRIRVFSLNAMLQDFTSQHYNYHIKLQIISYVFKSFSEIECLDPVELQIRINVVNKFLLVSRVAEFVLHSVIHTRLPKKRKAMYPSTYVYPPIVPKLEEVDPYFSYSSVLNLAKNLTNLPIITKHRLLTMIFPPKRGYVDTIVFCGTHKWIWSFTKQLHTSLPCPESPITNLLDAFVSHWAMKMKHGKSIQDTINLLELLYIYKLIPRVIFVSTLFISCCNPFEILKCASECLDCAHVDVEECICGKRAFAVVRATFLKCLNLIDEEKLEILSNIFIK